ncbi:MAG: MFS transporter, partial [Tannerella sp.]|nr:MFS transporter [Tannerella sp.]
MTEQIQRKLSDSKAARWTALIVVSFTMMCGYFITDCINPMQKLIINELGWSTSEYGFFTGSYGYFNVFLCMLVIGGLILDKKGVRFTGKMSCSLMVLGAAIKTFALSPLFTNTGMTFGIHNQVLVACLGFATFGVGCETAGITVSKIIVKWFTGHELALAMGLQVATARIGTALAMSVPLPIALHFHKMVCMPVLF